MTVTSSPIGLSIRQFFALLTLVCASGCGLNLAGTWQFKEISRTKSPDSLVEAVLVSGGAGATTSTVLQLYLVPVGAEVSGKEEEDCVFVADHIANLEVVWVKPKLLHVRYHQARIAQFQNFWRSADVEDYRYVVEIRLEPSDAEFSLPLSDRQW